MARWPCVRDETRTLRPRSGIGSGLEREGVEGSDCNRRGTTPGSATPRESREPPTLRVMPLHDAAIWWSDLVELGGDHAEAALQPGTNPAGLHHVCPEYIMELEGVAQMAVAMHAYQWNA